MARRRKQLMVNKGHVCAVDGCEDEAYSLGLCTACYARQHFWHKRTMADKVRRVKQIQRWENSLNMQLGNVRSISRKTG